MNAVQKLQHNVDRLQQNQPFLGFVVGAWKKFSDDQAGYLAALVSYYAFASIFPLLLVLYTVLELVLRGHASLQRRLESSALQQYPTFAHYLPKGHTVSGAGIALVIGLVLTFYGGRGVANAIQNALNTVWGVPFTRRPGFPGSLLRSFGLIIVIGVGQIVTISLAEFAGHASSFLPGPLAQIGAVAVALVLNIGTFWLAFRVGTAKEIATRDLRLGAIISGFTWTVLQSFATHLVSHLTKTSNSAYGTFGIVLGLLAWFYLQAQLTLYAVEFSVVKARGLWPRSMFPPPLMGADVHAYQLYAAAQQRRPELAVELRRTDQPGPVTARAEPAAGAAADRPGANGRAASGRATGGGQAASGASGHAAKDTAGGAGSPGSSREPVRPGPARGAGSPESRNVKLAGQILSAVAVAGALKRQRQRAGGAR